ncbi:DUF4175 domain-containing protein [Massilia soli]|uniref:DUF4175 domain-containing protein n=1 Tax=Massilia soli TaxID=2792854 RepID=A0ABS7SJE5_9BURK|nr:DUF4175 domain-containing protein [Massilia soli]MBZ2205940.1 DUF4175 domain-containing protein [Massilia soli]
MHANADISRRILLAAVWRRVPLWLAVALPWVLLRTWPGVLACAAWAAWDFIRLRQRVYGNWTRWIDGAVPELEDSSALLVRAETPVGRLQQQRLLARVSSAIGKDRLRAIARERVPLGLHWFAISAVAALGFWAAQLTATDGAVAAPSLARAAAVQKSELAMRITPPKYTGVAASRTAPRDLLVPEQTIVEWCLKMPREGEPPIELSDGQVLKIGQQCVRWTATESVFWRWRGARYNLKVVPDNAPRITVSMPKQMVQVLSPDATSARIAVEVVDDYAVTRATMHLTLARGSGENVRFSDREVPLPGSKDPRVRNWSKDWSLADLGMEPGDELYFFIRAFDNAGRAQQSQSPTYTLRLPGPVEEGEESTALPMLVKPENLRSQRQIIIDTEQLIADMKANPRLAAATLQDRSQKIAGDQAILRRRYGQFLGEESTLFGGEEEHSEGDGHDHGGGGAGGSSAGMIAEYGHMHDESENATMFDEATKKVLRRALSAMWDAEKALRAITPKPALAPEYKALEAIKELQQADRIYLHKTAFAPPAIKEEIRMTGDVVGAKSYRREQAAADQAIPAEVRALLQTLASDGALPALWTRDAQDWIRERIANDDQRLAAQRAVQDVADGCVPCRPVLRAWLRGAITEAPVVLQAKPVTETPFTRAWRSGAKP